MTKKIIAIWAQAEDGLIGKDKVMPWHLPAELQHFKATTTGHVILIVLGVRVAEGDHRLSAGNGGQAQ